MSQPVLEVADILRAWGGRFVERSRARVSWPQHKVMRAIERCRTAALGRHRDRCTRCGKDFGYSFNSCRNRHCPKCQTPARNRWVAARTQELVPLEYFHVVFTVPHQLSALMLQNKRTLYNLLFRCVAETLLEVAANPKRLGAEIGFLCVLHTWGQTLIHHPHIHCVVPAGGFAPGPGDWPFERKPQVESGRLSRDGAERLRSQRRFPCVRVYGGQSREVVDTRRRLILQSTSEDLVAEQIQQIQDGRANGFSSP